MAGDKGQLACEGRRAEMELAAGETDRKADRYVFIGLMIAERMQACGNPVEASCCDHRRLLDRAIPCAMIIVNQLAGTAVQERFIVFDDVTQVRSDLIAERRGMLEIVLCKSPALANHRDVDRKSTRLNSSN